jgi:hypothetical protein
LTDAEQLQVANRLQQNSNIWNQTNLSTIAVSAANTKML